MKRLIEKTVFFGLVTDWRFATCPTRRSPLLVKPTTEGVVRFPSALGMTFASLPSITATTLFVVPRSIPMILLTRTSSLLRRVHRAPARSDPKSKTLVAKCQLSATLYLTILDADLFQGRENRQSRVAAHPPSPPTPLPCVPPHTHAERERGAAAQPQNNRKERSSCFGRGRPLPLGAGGGGTRGRGSGRGL